MSNKNRIHLIWQNVKRSRLVWLTLILVISAATLVTVAAKSSPEQLWKKLTASFAAASIPAAPAEQTVGKQHYFQLLPTEVTRMVAGAPMEAPGVNVLNSQSVLTLPDPDGKSRRFRLLESPIITSEMAAKFPDIKSYAAQGIDDPATTARFSWTSRGLHGVILGNDYSIFVHPVDHTTTTNYVSYYAPQDTKFECGVKDSDPGIRGRTAVNGINTKIGGTLRTYRLAVATPAEYTLNPSLGGGTVASTVASLNVWVNEMNAVYEREMSIRFTLVNNTSIIYTDAGTDPFSNPTDPSTTLTEVRATLASVVGIANYDLGHALLVGDTGGVAYLGVVCDGSGSANKGGGVSGVPAPLGYAFGASRFMHETGHQFGATHTFNDVASCSSNREPTTAYEPGNGMTIMAYPVQCSTPIVPNRELRFHDGSLTQMVNFIAGTGGTCATTTSTGNNPPTVSGGVDRTIPRNTPFTLTATGSDPDVNDAAALSYVWEQIDAGGALYGNTTDVASFSDAGDPSTTTRPIFRPFSPSSNPSRTFPSLTYILNNANVPPGISSGLYTAENLPNVTRTLNFRVTLRDNRAGGGAFSDDHIVLNVDGNSGPFLVTSPNTAVSIPAGSLQTITWSVNNTNQAPVNCTNVKISLSTDGGQTFPYVLAASTPNEGSANVVLPNLTSTTTTARIKVEAVGNIFFDVSDANFTISSGPSCPAVTSFAPGAGSTGASVVITGTGFTSVTAVKFSNNVSASFTINNDSQITATQPAGAISGPITISKSGCSDVQTATYIACSTSATAQVDDGGYEQVNTGRYIVNRLTPSSYPATLRGVSIRIASTQYLQAGTPFILLAGVNADGDANINNTSFQTSSRTVTSTNAFVRYDLAQPITIQSGDFVVGYTFPNGGATSSLDTSSPQSRSYSSEDGLNFTVNPDGNYMIRADYLTSCDLGSAACPMVSGISPSSGQIGDTVTITGSGFTGVSGLTFNSNVIANFTVVSDTQITAIVPAGTTTGPITISEPTCSDVQTASFTVNAPVCMTVSGFSPPTALPGVPITITGTNFTGASVVKFSGDAAASFTVDSPTQITAIVPAGAIFGPITISKQGCADVQTANFSPCNSSFTLQVDDGGIEATAGTTSLRYYVNRLTPLSYPATLTAIQLRFDSFQNIPAGTALTLRTGVNPTGSTNINGISLTGQAATAGTVGQFNTYTLTTPVTINSGDFVIGFSITAPSGSGAEGLDTTNPQGRSYKSTDGGATFGAPAGGVGNYLIRGQYFRPCCSGVTITVSPSNGTLPGGQLNSFYSQTFTQSGGVGTATWSVSAGSLPAGLSLNASTGELSGTPTTPGTSNFTIRATDQNTCTGERAYSLTIACAAITITPATLTAGTAGTSYNQSLSASGGITPYTFSQGSGSLPTGLSLSGSGVISGVPTQTGTFTFTANVTDNQGCTGSASISLTINCQTITVTAPATNTGTAGAAFSQSFSQSGGIGTTNFTTASTLPTGITLSTAGVLAGTPTQTGSFPITVTATDSNGCTGSTNYTLTINCQTITVTAPATNTGTTGTNFSATFTQSGGIGTTNFTTASALPNGITLSTAGVLSGIPTQTGSFPITVKVTDSNGCTGSANYTLTISCGTITVTAPATNTGTANAAFSATFTQSGGIGTTNFTTTSTLPNGITLSTAGVLAGTPTQTGVFSITVKATDSIGCMGTVNYTLTINCQTITVTAPATNTGTKGSAFSQSFSQTGGIGTITFSTASTLPNGITLSTAGVLDGTPTVTGGFPITVTVTDGNGCTGSVNYTLTIVCQTITVTAPAVNSGVVNAAFSETFTQTGGIGTTNFSTISTLPNGITLSPAGVLSGTPLQNGSFPIVVKATDATAC
ncbi:MAG TPA: putative Ig domain-containing protein, partial [Blastocatellia bacterium]|nr:putative Ig domain-containing protein [Blastocatellia bacterium]